MEMVSIEDEELRYLEMFRAALCLTQRLWVQLALFDKRGFLAHRNH